MAPADDGSRPRAYACRNLRDRCDPGGTGVRQVGIEIPLAAYPAPIPQEAPCKASRVSDDESAWALRDLSEVPAVEVVTTVSIHLMTAAAIRCGLGDGPDAQSEVDLAEARILITALAGLVTSAAPDLGPQHAAPLRDGLSSLQRAFAEVSPIPDPPGQGPGESLTGPVR